ncbi:hypothetical protein TPHA_0B03380 [Tetrapisispora phaffii CBS 4417]|uniref:CCA tRNA nucleotidyltransferase, mitochondrial n=1 Tax=Tetrapisispora phaffii (strain ATCC 24235 / CBS 4417 / NBRC 1672 / NRRL Y-8282 / UCD 70-5) TaxID=1071381 RepID=G8BPS8_TETPH|nr:hypothetical protein TPHA_0B03380 [Tetrapisispora phaffii CBS 4417]CCE62009.1 hypothetical protein TPHA_0B03380 [Tetrapisispora phaffii CBS 4417]
MYSYFKLLNKSIIQNKLQTIICYRTMSTSQKRLPAIQLTPLESKICTLLNEFTSDYNASNNEAEALELRITGGWVRDKLLGSQSNDLDIAVNIMSGESFALKLNDYLTENFRKYNVEPHSIHKIDKNPEKSKHLETATTKLFGVEVDFVNLRSEEYTDDSRIPTVEFGTPKQDALRRDATLNALFYNIGKNEIEDLTNSGLQDLKDRTLRTPLPPRKTFLDDPLRILRLIRFASRYNFKLDPETLETMKDSDINLAFYVKISRERIGVEMEKIIDGETPLIGINLIQYTHIDNVIFHWHNDNTIVDFNKTNNTKDFNLISEIYDNSVLNAHIKDVVKVLNNKAKLENDIPILYSLIKKSPAFKRIFLLGFILLPFQNLKIIWNVKKKVNNKIPVTESIVKDGLKFNKNEASLIALIVDSIEHYNEIVTKFNNDRNSLSRSEIGLFLREFKGNWQVVHFVTLLNQLASKNESCLNNYSNFYNYIIESDLKDCYDLRPLINGKRLLTLSGMKPGPWMGKINDLAIVWQLEHPDGTEDQLLEHLKSLLPTVI